MLSLLMPFDFFPDTFLFLHKDFTDFKEIRATSVLFLFNKNI